MKKIINGLCLVLICFSFCLLPCIANAQTANVQKQEALDITGKEWINSSLREKHAFLIGASAVVAIENIVAEKTNDPASVFIIRWTEAFKNKSWVDIQEDIDTWYANNPDKQDRHLLDLIWYEFVVPNSKEIAVPDPKGKNKKKVKKQ